jgi:methionyl aminopeptidase
MTEKQYGGSTKFGVKDSSAKQTNSIPSTKVNEKNQKIETEIEKTDIDIEKIKKAGEIASKTKEYAKTIVKRGVKLKEIAEKIESKIIELGGKPAFPVNLSINEIAAHYTPSWNDETLAHGLLKVDLGCHIDGWVADTALSFDLENSEENKKLIETAQSSLKKALEKVSLSSTLREIGESIEKEVKRNNLQPIINLSGHSIEQWTLHSGITIPNYDNNQNIQLEEGTYAIEPFVTTGVGLVRDGKPSGIYQIQNPGNVRDNFAREVLNFILDEYSSLPFCSRWIYDKFGSRGLLSLRQIESAGILHSYSQLIEKSNAKVAQAEQTVLLTKNEKIVTTA